MARVALAGLKLLMIENNSKQRGNWGRGLPVQVLKFKGNITDIHIFAPGGHQKLETQTEWDDSSNKKWKT